MLGVKLLRSAPVVLVRLAVRFVEAFSGASGVWPAVVRVRGHSRRSTSVRGGRGGAVSVGDPSRVRVWGRWRGSVAGGPWGARVRVPLGQALFIGGGLVVALIERPVAFEAVGRRRPAPASAMGRAWGPVHGRGASVVGRVVGRCMTRRGPVVEAPVVVRRREVSRRRRAQAPWSRRPVAGFTYGRGVGDMRTGHGGRLGQLSTTSARSAGPGGRRDGAAAHRTTALQQNVNKENQNAPQQQQQNESRGNH